jgi:hypothetical protein
MDWSKLNIADNKYPRNIEFREAQHDDHWQDFEERTPLSQALKHLRDSSAFGRIRFLA